MNKSRYCFVEIAGTLFLMHGDLVVAANVGEQGNITETTVREFKFLCDCANEKLDSQKDPA